MWSSSFEQTARALRKVEAFHRIMPAIHGEGIPEAYAACSGQTSAQGGRPPSLGRITAQGIGKPRLDSDGGSPPYDPTLAVWQKHVTVFPFLHSTKPPEDSGKNTTSYSDYWRA